MSQGKDVAAMGGQAPWEGSVRTVSCREQASSKFTPSQGGNGLRAPNPGRWGKGIWEGFPEKVLSKQSPGGVSRAKGRVTRFQVKRQRQKLSRTRAGVSAVGARTVEATG